MEKIDLIGRSIKISEESLNTLHGAFIIFDLLTKITTTPACKGEVNLAGSWSTQFSRGTERFPKPFVNS